MNESQELKTAQESLRDANRDRVEAFAKEGVPIPIAGLEQHLIVFLIERMLGEDARVEALLEWEKKVSTALDNADEQVRYAKLTAGVSQQMPASLIPRR